LEEGSNDQGPRFNVKPEDLLRTGATLQEIKMVILEYFRRKDMKMQIRQILVLFVLLALPAASAWADSEVRPATPFEQEYILRVLTGFDKSMPQKPADWTETGRTGVKAPEHMAVGAAGGPLRISYRVEWEDRTAKAAAAKRMQEASQSIAMPDEAALEEINVEMEKLSQEMVLAAQNGDRQSMQRLQKEAEKLAAKSQVAFASTDAQIRQIQQLAPKDADIEIKCAANTFDKSLYSPARQASISGANVYRVEEKDPESENPGASYVFLGDWDIRENGDYTMFSVEPRADRIPASVQTIIVTIRAEDRLARKMLEKIDLQALGNLIEK